MKKMMIFLILCFIVVAGSVSAQSLRKDLIDKHEQASCLLLKEAKKQEQLVQKLLSIGKKTEEINLELSKAAEISNPSPREMVQNFEVVTKWATNYEKKTLIEEALIESLERSVLLLKRLESLEAKIKLLP